MRWKTLLIWAIVNFISFPALMAQSDDGPSCSPKACGPGNTKTKEAKVITDLRGDLQKVMDRLADSEIKFNEEVVHQKLVTGSTDDESLLYISEATRAVRIEVIEKVAPDKLLPALKQPIPPSNSKQRLVANLKSEIKTLAEQAASL